MVGRNERKAVVLGLLLRVGSVTTRDLLERWDLSHSGGQASLEKYRRGSLLTRQREPGPGPPVYRYRLTITGRRKAEWFIRQTSISARNRPRVTRHKAQANHRQVIRPKRVRRVIRPLIHLSLAGEQLEEETTTKAIRPKIHRRRVVRPEIHHVGEEQW